MSKKRKNKGKNLRTISKSQKALYGAIFGILFAALIVFGIKIFSVYKLIYKPMGYLYVEPVFSAVLALLFVLMGQGVILLIHFYGSLTDRKKTLKQIKQRAKKILPIYLVLAIAASTLCFPAYYCIDDTAAYRKNTLFGSEVLFAKEDIKNVDICVLGLSAVPSSGRMAMKYSIACTLSTENGEYTINSNSFYGYREMYDYLSGLNATVKADRDKLDKLIDYQRRPANFSAEKVNENIEYINKIFALENV